MKASDALELAILYDKYEFVEGRELCSAVIVDYFELTTQFMEKKYTLDIDFIIDLVIVVHKANLEAAFKQGITYIWKKLTRIEAVDDCGPYSVSNFFY